MSPSPDPDDLGRQLYVARFLPLPDIDRRGELIGTRMWRVRDGYVECLALRKNGLAHAVRAEASFDYTSPTDHGPVVGHRFGVARYAFEWLLHTEVEPDPPLIRRYVEPFPQDVWRAPDEREDPR